MDVPLSHLLGTLGRKIDLTSVNEGCSRVKVQPLLGRKALAEMPHARHRVRMTSLENTAQVFDRKLVRLRRNRAASAFVDVDFLKRRVTADIADRLETVTRDFTTALDLGSHGGYFRREVEVRPDLKARIEYLVETDLSGAMLGRAKGAALVADEEMLPFAPRVIDLVVSSLALHWVNDLPGSFAQIRRALKPDGLFIASFIGGRTLSDFRASFIEAESEVRGGAVQRMSPFADVQDIAGLLQRAGFALPVADIDTVEVRYRDPFRLLRDLRAMGEASALLDRSGPCLTREILLRAMELFADRSRDKDGKYVARFDIVTATGWAPADSQPKPLRPGSAKMRLADALGVTEQKLLS